jgi:hypothetical protein
MVLVERLEGENLTATQERRIDGEKWILGRGANENDDSFFYIGQQNILLGTVETVKLVHEKDRAHAGMFELGSSLIQNFSNFLDAGGNGVDLSEAAVSVLGNDVRQGRFACAGRSVKDQRAESIGLKHAPEELPGADEMLLADEFLQQPRPHPRRQRLGLFQIRFMDVFEKVDGRCSFLLQQIQGDNLFQITSSPDFPGG